MKESTKAALREEARKRLFRGNRDFKVIAAGERHGSKHFVVGLPMAVKRQGVFGRVSSDLGSGPTTKFGDRLFDSLRIMEGVDPGITREQPYIVELYIDGKRPHSNIDLGGSYPSVQGLPADVCVTIQAVILWNRGPGQIFFQYLRGLF